MKKRILSLVLVLSMLCAFMPIVATAATSGVCGADGDNLTWTLDDEGTLTISGEGDMEDYYFSPFCNRNIKSVIIENGVTSIGNYAFSDCTSLKSVTIPDSVTSIGNHAFYKCTVLASVTIPNGVTTIGEWAFARCKGLTSVTIPDSVTTIGEGAFYSCESLTSVTIPDGVTTIGNSAFFNTGYYNDENNWEDGVLYIGNCLIAANSFDIPAEYEIKNETRVIADNAFYYCDDLTSVTIPDSVTNIGYGAFHVCGGLTDIDVSLNNSTYSSSDGVLFNKDKTELIQYAVGKTDNTYIIPNSVTNIADYAFYKCSALTNVTIPNSVTNIGFGAFYGCESLTSVTIPDSVTTIGESAFEYCDGLTSVTIGNSITSIADYAFYECKSLTSVTIGNGVTNIGEWAFSCCGTLTSVTIPNGVTTIAVKAFFLCTGLTSVTIPNSVKSIGGAAFSGCSSLTSVIIPNSVTDIGSSTFAGCSSLTSVTIPNSVTNISDGAFQGCSSLTSVTIGNSVTDIGDYAFGDCSALTNVTIPDSVTSIGFRAFYNCSGLTDVYYSGSEEDWNDISIDSDNECLTGATIHYNSTPTPAPTAIPLTTAEIARTDAETDAAYSFDVDAADKYEDCYVYAAVYDENGVLLAVNCVPLDTAGGTSVSVSKGENDALIKVFILADTLQPIIEKAAELRPE